MKSAFLRASTLFLAAAASSSAASRVLQTFEGDGFGDWMVEGEGFGLAPVTGNFAGVPSGLTGYSGESLACSAHGGGSATGSLTSPPFAITEPTIAFLIAGGDQPGKTAVQLLLDEKVAMEASGDDSARLRPVVWDVSKLKGKVAKLRIIDAPGGQPGFIAADQFILTDNPNPDFPPTTRETVTPSAKLTASANVPGLTIPAGTKARVVADFKNQQVTSPTALSFGSNGELYLTETHRFRHGVPDNRDHLYWYLDDISSHTVADRMRMYEKWQHQEPSTSLKFLTEKSEIVRVLSQPDADGVFQKQNVFADGFNDALNGTAAGVFDYEGTVFTACIPKIYALRDADGDGRAEIRDVVQDGFGVRVSFSGHDLNGFALSPDGRLYGTFGDRGLNLVTKEGVHYELPDEGGVFRFDPDGSHFEIVHTGLRNPKEIAFDEFGNGISVDNNCDQGDKARVVYVVEGADSGWNMGHQGLLSHSNQVGLAEPPPARWNAERMWELPNPEQPASILPPVAHITSGPSGLAYHPGTGFLESEAGHFFICDYKGSPANSGIWSFRVEPSGAGMKMTDPHRLNWGAAVTDVDFSWDGKLTVTDFITGWESHDDGRVYSVEAEKPWRAAEAAQVPALIREGFEKRAPGELAGLLHHPDLRVRTRAQIALTRKPDGLAPLAEAATQTADRLARLARLARLHGVWGLGIIARRGSAALPAPFENPPADPALREKARDSLVSLLADPDDEVRAQAVKMLGESGIERDIPSLIGDASPRVRLFACIAAGRMKSTASVPAILQLLENNDDPYLRHAGSYALSLIAPADQLAALKSHPSPKVRLAAVVALGRLKSDALAGFLADSDPAVADEATRAINDRNLTTVRPQVADLLDLPAPAGRTAMMWRRLLHSAFRTGDETNARRVLKVALDPQTPADSRAEAFRLLNEWNAPHPVDQSTGRMAPLPARDPALIRGVLAGSISALVRTDGEFLEPALALVQTYHLALDAVPDDALKSLVLNESVPGPARVSALDLYAARKPAGLDPLLTALAAGTDDDVTIGALRLLARATPDSALAGLATAVRGGSAHLQQEAWKLAAAIPLPAAGDLIATGLDDLKKHNGVSPAALELLDAASTRPESAVKSALAAFKTAQASSADPLAAFLPSLQGGDPESGGRIFESHPAGQCMRCHAGGHGGGDAGPDLSGVGLRGDPMYFLESLINPGAKVAMGYGIASVTLKGGKCVAGIVIADTSDHVDLDSSGKVLRVPRAVIDTMTPPVSAMPPMAAILSPREIRDLIAWLSERKSDKHTEKTRPAPELVGP